MPHRSPPQPDLSWPPAEDDLAVMDLARHKDDARPPAPKQAPVPPAPRTAPRKAAGTPAPADREAILPPPRQRQWPVFAGRVRPRIMVAMLAFALLAATAVILGRTMVGREGGPGGSPAAAASPAPGRPNPPPAAATGSLAVSTQPPGAAIVVDGRPVGASPVTLPSIAAGDHVVVIQHGRQTIRHTAQIAAGQSVSIVVPIPAAPAPPPAPARGDGSIRVEAPVELRVTGDGRLLGTSEMARIPVAPGTHTLNLVNEATGYQITRTVTVAAGRTTTVEVNIPEERVSINAIPWAEVLVDGRPVGQTPLGALRLPIGRHVIVLRHPRLGEKTITTTVKAGEPSRISVDMRS